MSTRVRQFAVSLILALCIVAPAREIAAAAGPDTLHYTVMLAGHSAGAEVVSRSGGGWTSTYQYTDRGRGPSLRQTMVAGAGGLPAQVSITGHDYLKAPIDETFSIHDGIGSWKNRAESGSAKAVGRFYVGLSSTPAELGMLARALLAAPGRKLALLPDGEARIEPRGEMTLRRSGVTRTVRHYRISGLDFSPIAVWLDRDGAVFAEPTGWLSLVREGWEESLDTLLEVQDRMDAERLTAIARRASRRPKGALAIEHARLFDAATATMLPGRTVILQGERIAAVGEDGQVPIPAGAERIDATGKSLLPGLWDMHVHLQPGDGLQDMACGITSVRDLGNDIEGLAAIQKRYDDGTHVGPRILRAGIIDGRGPFHGPTPVLVDSLPEALQAIDHYADLGYVQIKIYSSIHPELVEGMAAEAHRRGLRVSGHVPAFMTADRFVRAGADEIQHMNFVFLNFLADSVPDTRTPARFTAVARLAATLDLTSPRVREFIALLKQRGTVVDPTLGIFEGMFTDRPGQVARGFAPIAGRLPVQVRRQLLNGGLEVPDGMDARHRDSFTRMEQMTRMLFDAGVPLVAGTDNLAGFTLHRELEIYAEAGIPAAKVLQIATLGAARVMKRDADLGSIAPGKLADVILVAGDPAERISDIRNVELVVKGGVVHRAADLCEALGVRARP